MTLPDLPARGADWLPWASAVKDTVNALEARPRVLVLAAGAPVPDGTPAGTVILRTA